MTDSTKPLTALDTLENAIQTDPGLPDDLRNNVFTSKLSNVINWARKNSFFQYPFVTACCGMEFMSVAASHYDIARFGAEVPRFSPRQSDVLFVVGTVTPRAISLVASGANGIVTEFKVEQGQFVRKGDVLSVLRMICHLGELSFRIATSIFRRGSDPAPSFYVPGIRSLPKSSPRPRSWRDARTRIPACRQA